MDKTDVVHANNEISFRLKQLYASMCDNMDRPGEKYIK